MVTRRQVIQVSAAAAGISLAHAVGAQALQPVNVIAFGGGVNWPIWVAQEKGFFAANGLQVNLQFTPNSVESMTGLVTGKYDIAMAAIDNLVAYMEGQGEAPLPKEPEFFAFIGNQRGMLRVVAQSNIKSYVDLKGQSVAVDSLGTGFAFVLYKMIQEAGVALTDVKFERLGATPMRVQAMIEGKTSASIINAPLDLPLMQRGFTRLGDATTALGSYQGTVATANRPWAKANDAAMLGYTKAWSQALRFLSDPANRSEALEIYMKHMKVELPAAEAGFNLLLGSNRAEGLNRDGRIDLEGVRTVLKLRSEFGKPAKLLTDPAKYVDESWLNRV